MPVSGGAADRTQRLRLALTFHVGPDGINFAYGVAARRDPVGKIERLQCAMGRLVVSRLRWEELEGTFQGIGKVGLL